MGEDYAGRVFHGGFDLDGFKAVFRVVGVVEGSVVGKVAVSVVGVAFAGGGGVLVDGVGSVGGLGCCFGLGLAIADGVVGVFAVFGGVFDADG